MRMKLELKRTGKGFVEDKRHFERELKSTEKKSMSETSISGCLSAVNPFLEL